MVRRVLSGTAADGRSTIVVDEEVAATEETPRFAVAELWREPGGLAYRIVTFPPGSVTRMHRTQTLDVLTVLSGELYAVLETTETLLRPGDSFVQRGTAHAWRTHGDRPAVAVALMVPVTR